MNDKLKQLQELGYEVEEAFKSEDDMSVYTVKGFGIETYVNDGQDDIMKGLLDSHDERAKQIDETQQETLMRWHDDPDIDFTLESDQLKQIKQAADGLRNE